MEPEDIKWCGQLNKKNGIMGLKTVLLYWIPAKYVGVFKQNYNPTFDRMEEFLTVKKANHVLCYNFGMDRKIQDYEDHKLPDGTYLLVGYQEGELDKYIKEIECCKIQKIKKTPYGIKVVDGEHVIHQVKQGDDIGDELKNFLIQRKYCFGAIKAAILTDGKFKATEMIELINR